MIQIAKSVTDQIATAAAKGLPLETCGYLGGQGRRISHFVELSNKDASPEHFSFTPAEQFAAVRSLRDQGLEVKGIWHSHPVSPARPSEEDIRLAKDPSLWYLIYSLLPEGGGYERLRAFSIVKGEVKEEILAVYDDTAAAPAVDLAELKKVGTLQQKQKEWFALRLRLVGGDIDWKGLEVVSRVAADYGSGEVHLSTRQGIEIPWVHASKVVEARSALEAAGLKMGACGPRVRVVVACPGSKVCRWGVVDTKSMAKKLDNEFFGQEAPHKFKFGVTGCAHNCAKATENDVGVMGAVKPVWDQASCTDCKLCLNVCPTKAISRDEGRYVLDEAKCIYCAICSSSCPASSWKREQTGWLVWAGGTMGKIPRFATKLGPIIEDEKEVQEVVRRALAWFRHNGKKRERFGHALDRVGLEAATKEIYHGVSDTGKN